ncbi:HAD family phosphatase [Ferrimonas gelatinilytica]|uniref:HAD family phosphatase n=1 Tax=Ferrimonas gelatinilytica TaxID=1255257 RepID=A0ABP9RW42_9GAMM
MSVSAAIFDMDGLLLDTERVCMSIFQQTCEAQGYPFLEPVYLSIIGCNAGGIERLLRQGYGPQLDYPKLRQAWRQRYHARVAESAIPIKPGVQALLTWLRQQGAPLAVATSSDRELAEVKLRLSGLAPLFDSVTTGCEVVHGKPHPEIYQLAARRLGVDPRHCLAFEDSNNGSRAAVAAGMITYQIPDLVQPDETTRALGHRVLPNLFAVLEELQQANGRVPLPA